MQHSPRLTGLAVAAFGFLSMGAAPELRVPTAISPPVFVELRVSLQKLDLDAAQRARIEEHFRGPRGDALVIGLDRLMQARKALRVALWSGADEATLRAQGRKVGEILADTAVVYITFERLVRAELTAAQVRQLQQMRRGYESHWHDELAWPMNAGIFERRPDARLDRRRR